MSELRHIYQVEIRTTPERLWAAIVDNRDIVRYYFETTIDTDWRPGSSYTYNNADGDIVLRGEIVEVDPPRRLVTTFELYHNADAREDPPSTVTWLIEQRGDTCLLTLTHDGFAAENTTYRSVNDGWPHIIAGLKELLEGETA